MVLFAGGEAFKPGQGVVAREHLAFLGGRGELCFLFLCELFGHLHRFFGFQLLQPVGNRFGFCDLFDRRRFLFNVCFCCWFKFLQPIRHRLGRSSSFLLDW